MKGKNLLTLEQTLQWGRGAIWLQEKGFSFAHCVVYDLEHSPFLRFKIVTPRKWDRHLKYRGSEYGETWRCFDRKPTETELAAPFAAEKKGA